MCRAMLNKKNVHKYIFSVKTNLQVLAKIVKKRKEKYEVRSKKN